MKSFRFFAVVVLTMLGSAVFAQSKTDRIKVSGNCGMCKQRIETALKVPGITAAEYDVKTKLLTLRYDAAKLNLNQVEQMVAAAGHDTPNFKATDAAYSKLHDCCKYERESKSVKADQNH